MKRKLVTHSIQDRNPLLALNIGNDFLKIYLQNEHP